jgi:hypothetical protein
LNIKWLRHIEVHKNSMSIDFQRQRHFDKDINNDCLKNSIYEYDKKILKPFFCKKISPKEQEGDKFTAIDAGMAYL